MNILLKLNNYFYYIVMTILACNALQQWHGISKLIQIAHLPHAHTHTYTHATNTHTSYANAMIRTT